MNKTAIKNFAIWARVQLIESAKQRAFEYEITENGENKPNIDAIGGRLLTADEKKQRAQLISQIKEKGYTQVMEEAAYTWFNRFIALRFMEVNGYLPSKIRVFTDENGAFKPEIMKEAMSVELDGLDKDKVLKLIDAQANEELYKYLLITQCNALNAGLPYMFEKIANWTELLFPANLLRGDSIVGQMISEIPEEDWTDAVQIIGWMYQYYWGDLREILNDKNIVEKSEIPIKTQFFTPDWIVRYMVENSLGRLWYEGHNDFDKSQWKYYLDEAEQEPEVEQQLKKIRAEYATIKPEEIKVIDPCMGSGHILVYAFDVLMQIYTSAGWSERDAAKSIIENNLYGLDIDDRAGQLAYFAVMMKARKYSRRILNGDVKPNVFSIQESNWMDDDFIAYVSGKDANMKADLIMLRKAFKDAKEYGSILNVPAMNYVALYERIDIIGRSYIEDLFEAQYQSMAIELLRPLVRQSQIMSQKYDVITTNPPYLGVKKYNNELSLFINQNYSDYKYDLFSCVVSKAILELKPNRYAAFITQQTWLNVDSFEKFRKRIITSTRLLQAIHLGASTMEGGLGTVSFVFSNTKISNYLTLFDNLTKETVESKETLLFKDELQTKRIIDNFLTLPKLVFSYSLSNRVLDLFENAPLINQTTEPRSGLVTRNNARFLRNWFEVNWDNINFCCDKHDFTCKWYPHVKGGGYRKWYGNYDFVVNWKNNGAEIREATKDANGGSVVSEECYFEEGLSWSLSTFSAKISLRYLPQGMIFNVEAPAVFNVPNSWYMLGLLNSKVGLLFLDIVSDDVHYKTKDVGSTPYIQSTKYFEPVRKLVTDNINASKYDWDSFETSWNFTIHPLI